jgi:phage repressor protein C with HTH and peptisase S24 domain
MKLKPAAVADAAGVGRSFVYDILRGKSENPRSDKLMRVAAVLQTSAESLLYGEDDGLPAVGTIPDRDYVAIPFVKVEAAMGGGAIVDDEEEGEPWHFGKAWLRNDLCLGPTGLRLILVRGDSMEPTLLDGDVVMVDTAQTSPSPAGIFVLHDGFGLVAKRLEYLPVRDPPAIRVISDNIRYGAIERPAEEIRIIGRIVWFARRL